MKAWGASSRLEDVPPPQDISESQPLSLFSECGLCNELLMLGPCTALSCSHEHHAACVEALAKMLGPEASHLCPQCPPNPDRRGELDRAFEDAARVLLVVERRVARGDGAWGAPPPDEERRLDGAAATLRMCAERGHSWAQLLLGELLCQGRAGGRGGADPAAGLKMATSAAEHGLPEAQFFLAELYDPESAAHHLGGPPPAGAAPPAPPAAERAVLPDETVAARWYKRAADQGHTPSLLALGDMYQEGRGVARSERVSAVANSTLSPPPAAALLRPPPLGARFLDLLAVGACRPVPCCRRRRPSAGGARPTRAWPGHSTT